MIILTIIITLLLEYGEQGHANSDFAAPNVTETFLRDSAALNDASSLPQINSINSQHLLFDSIPLMLITDKLQTWFQVQRTIANSQCAQDLYDFFLGLKNMQLWAIKMLDSFGKLPSGLLDGKFEMSGNYDQCMRVTAIPHVNETSTRTFKTHYCWVTFSVHLNAMNMMQLNVTGFHISYLTFKLAVCMPDTCKEQELTNIIKSIPMGNSITIQNVTCTPKNVSLWTDSGAVTAFTICCIIATLLFVGTLLDLYEQQKQCSKFSCKKLSSIKVLQTNHTDENTEPLIEENQANSKILPPISVQKKKGLAISLLLSFSVYTNGSKLLKISTSKDTIPTLNGIRFISMTWVILGHAGAWFIDLQTGDLVKIWNSKHYLWYQIILKGILACDTFFLLSGLLTAYLFLKSYDKSNGKISWIKMYIHRYWRLTPPYALFMYVIHMKLSYYISDGPHWPPKNPGSECENSWWTNLLYINNLVGDKKCMPTAWYLANDMQFFWIISPVILIPLVKRKMFLMWFLAGSLISSSIAYTATMLIHHDYTKIMSTEDITTIDIQKIGAMFKAVNNDVYIMPYARMVPYIMGLIFGWMLYKQKTAIKLETHWVILGWLLTTIVAILTVLGQFIIHMSPNVEAIHMALGYCTWPACVCWVIYASVNGYGGIVNHILSWPVWNPLSRLTYMVYISHDLAMMVFWNNFDPSPTFNFLFILIFYTSSTMVTYLLACVLSLAFEMPFLAMEKIVFRQSIQN